MDTTQTKEPVALSQTVAGVVAAIVTILAAKGIVIDAESVKSIVVVAVGAYSLAMGVAAWWSRRKVTPVAKAQTAINTAYAATPGIDPKPTLDNPTAAK